jgi:hypothetical protein
MAANRSDLITLVGVGDISPSRDDPPSIFRHCGNVFRDADIVFGQMEAPLSDRGAPTFTPHSPTRLAAKNVTALTEAGAGFDVMSFACNHAMDYGYDAFDDTLELLKKHNIPTVGAGMNIQEARKPAIIERNGVRVGFLGYLSIVFAGLVADEGIRGCAPLRALNFYHQVDFQPGTPPLIITQLYPDDRKAMEDDIRKLRPQVDVLVVSMHCGVHIIPEIIATYQKEAGYAAIDAGADLVLQHHAHILKGIDTYKGKVIFYSLGDFALEHSMDFKGKKKAADPLYRKARASYLKNVKHPPGYEKHDFHPDALKTLVAKAYIRDKRIQKVTYLPTFINTNLEPEILTRKDPRAQEVFDYMVSISESQELNVKFAWEGDEVMVTG